MIRRRNKLVLVSAVDGACICRYKFDLDRFDGPCPKRDGVKIYRWRPRSMISNAAKRKMFCGHLSGTTTRNIVKRRSHWK